jgi:hypothetical protein
MTEPGRERVDSLKVVGIIERLEGGLSLAEEPAGFIAALESPGGKEGEVGEPGGE